MTDNPTIRIHDNRIENRVLFTIKTGYYFKLLTSEMMKLYENTKSKTNNNESGENVSHLIITKIV